MLHNFVDKLHDSHIFYQLLQIKKPAAIMHRALSFRIILLLRNQFPCLNNFIIFSDFVEINP